MDRPQSGRNEKGHYTVDTADKVSEMISRFLLEKDFEGFVKSAEITAKKLICLDTNQLKR